MNYLDNIGLNYFWSKIKTYFTNILKEECFILKDGTLLNQNDDLNDYYTIGNYRCATGTIYKTLTNLPEDVNWAFSLKVMATQNTNNILQLLIPNNSGGTGFWLRKGVKNSTTGVWSYSTWKKLIDSSEAIVTPEMYGAKGDGSTDDTYAIQTCINKNPNTTIIFKGNYLITNTIKVPGNTGGQTLILGSSNIIWNGADFSGDATKFMIDVDRTTVTYTSIDSLPASGENGILYEIGSLYYCWDSKNKNYYEVSIGKESHCYIIGGIFRCSDKIGGLRANLYHTTFENCKVLDAPTEAIAIGSSGGGRSLQCTLTNCMVMVATASTLGWSNENSGIGIAIYQADNVITGCNINRMNKSVYLRSSGISFSDCHFTAEYKEATRGQNIAETYAIYLEPYSQTSINSEILNTIYFDNHKYCIYAATPTRKTFNVNNSKYFWSGRQATGIVDTYMTGGYFVNTKVNNFTIVPVGGRCRFYDASICHDMAFQARGMLQQEYNKTVYTLLDEAFVPYTANHLCNDNETIEVYRNTPLAEGEYIMIGCLMVHETADELARTPSARFKLYNRTYGDYDFIVHWSAAGVPSLAVLNIYTPSTGLHFVIGAYQSITLAGTEYQYIPLYLTGSTAGAFGLIEMYTETGTNVGVYLLNDKDFITTNVTPALDIDLGQDRQRYTNFRSYNTTDWFDSSFATKNNNGFRVNYNTSDAAIQFDGNDTSRSNNSDIYLGGSYNKLKRLYLADAAYITNQHLSTLKTIKIPPNETVTVYMPAGNDAAVIWIGRISANNSALIVVDYQSAGYQLLTGNDSFCTITKTANGRILSITNNSTYYIVVTNISIEL